jgi:hypothetical protein
MFRLYCHHQGAQNKKKKCWHATAKYSKRSQILEFGNTRRSEPNLTSFIFREGPRSRCYRRTAALRLITQPCDEDDSFFSVFPSNGAPVEWNWQGKTEVLGKKTCPSVTLFTTKPTWTSPGLDPDLRGEKPATNRLSHDTALGISYYILLLYFNISFFLCVQPVSY